MPQLFPMNWNLLILFFLIILIVLTSLIYFNFNPFLNKKMLISKTLSKNWKW
uniref:ATP synthase F0 subunit 8 n=1 Tax=Alectorobius puertoricensis TaxID=48824 RepID=UPI0022371229|nr:ATP synthase F0 subunit 8 [Alectorobius puertoricensis]UYB78538.1 ATP synthase F0 subunit 8 [Alectorobius puertoricensis]UYB78551.1 ATP synthase F0 subunit 8 [Alectorobius puertoricensis]